MFSCSDFSESSLEVHQSGNDLHLDSVSLVEDPELAERAVITVSLNEDLEDFKFADDVFHENPRLRKHFVKDSFYFGKRSVPLSLERDESLWVKFLVALVTTVAEEPGVWRDGSFLSPDVEVMDSTGIRAGYTENLAVRCDLDLGLDRVSLLLAGVVFPLSAARTFDRLFGGIHDDRFELCFGEGAVFFDGGDFGEHWFNPAYGTEDGGFVHAEDPAKEGVGGINTVVEQ